MAGRGCPSQSGVSFAAMVDVSNSPRLDHPAVDVEDVKTSAGPGDYGVAAAIGSPPGVVVSPWGHVHDARRAWVSGVRRRNQTTLPAASAELPHSSATALTMARPRPAVIAPASPTCRSGSCGSS